MQRGGREDKDQHLCSLLGHLGLGMKEDAELGHMINKEPVFQSGTSGKIVSATSVLELEVKQKMFWNRLTRTYM